MQTTHPKQMDSQQQIQGISSLSGIDAIFNHPPFYNKASSMYYYAVRSYLDITHSSIIQESIQQSDPNLLYSVNSSALWMLLKDKIKRLNKMQIFENLSDKITVKYVLTFASYMCLNEAKEKVIEKEREMLRKDLKDYLQNKIKRQVNRKGSMLEQFGKSPLFNKICEQLNIKNDYKQQLKSSLIDFKFTKTSSLVSFLQRCLNYIQKTIQKRQSQSRQSNLTISNRAQANSRQAFIILLLCNYLNIYIVIGDWIKIILNDKEKRLTKLIFSHITEKKGFHIINRVLDDAPLSTIVEEIKKIQSNFYK